MRSQPKVCLQKSLHLILTKGLQVSIKFINTNWQEVGSLSLKLIENKVTTEPAMCGLTPNHKGLYEHCRLLLQQGQLPFLCDCLKSVATVTLGREIKFQRRSHLPVALLHHAYFLDNLLQVCINRNLFDSHNLP